MSSQKLPNGQIEPLPLHSLYINRFLEWRKRMNEKIHAPGSNEINLGAFLPDAPPMQVSELLPLEVGLLPAPRLRGIRRRKRLRPFGQGARVAPEGQARMVGQTHPKKPSTSHTSRPLPLPANTAASRPSGENIRNRYFTMPRLLRWRHGPRRRFAPGPTGIAPKDRVPSWTASASEPTPSACPKTRSAPS